MLETGLKGCYSHETDEVPLSPKKISTKKKFKAKKRTFRVDMFFQSPCKALRLASGNGEVAYLGKNSRFFSVGNG